MTRDVVRGEEETRARPATAVPTIAGDEEREPVEGVSPDELIHTKPLMDAVLRAEAEFANRDYAPYIESLVVSPTMFAKYERPTQLWDWRQLASLLLGSVRGKSLLDYGCGMGEESIYFAKLGARVTAIDISEVGIAATRKRAELHKLDVRAFEMRCDPTSFPPASFERIHGLGILHHVGIEVALDEVWRLLRPGGVGVFLEPLGDHPGIEAAKTFLLKQRRWFRKQPVVTEHERNLTWAEIESATDRFSRAVTFPYHLGYRVKRFIPRALHTGVRKVDHALLTMAPSLKRYAGAVVIQVVK